MTDTEIEIIINDRIATSVAKKGTNQYMKHQIEIIRSTVKTLILQLELLDELSETVVDYD